MATEELGRGGEATISAILAADAVALPEVDRSHPSGSFFFGVTVSVSGTTKRGQYSAQVIANRLLCREHYQLLLKVAEFPASRPGQFIQVCCENDNSDSRPTTSSHNCLNEPIVAGTELLQKEAFLRRPFSLAGRRDLPDGVELSIIHRIVGVGTGWMSRLAVGQTLSLIGPLGNGFQLPEPDELAILVGGGVGIPPMLYLAEKLKGRRAVAFSGALCRDLLPLTVVQSPPSDSIIPMVAIGEFAEFGIESVITTDDGTIGFRGFVTQALERYLDGLDGSLKPVLYTCGPEPMMKRVAEIAIERGIRCQVAVERSMACGMGTCQSCVIRVKKPDPATPPMAGSDWCYRLACTDGPVFSADALLW